MWNASNWPLFPRWLSSRVCGHALESLIYAPENPKMGGHVCRDSIGTVCLDCVKRDSIDFVIALELQVVLVCPYRHVWGFWDALEILPRPNTVLNCPLAISNVRDIIAEPEEAIREIKKHSCSLICRDKLLIGIALRIMQYMYSCMLFRNDNNPDKICISYYFQSNTNWLK